MKTLTWKTYAVAIMGLITLLWMIFSTNLIAQWQNQAHGVDIIEGETLEWERGGLSFIDVSVAEQNNPLFDTVKLKGYVYNISHCSDEDATRSLLLSSKDRSYRIQLTEGWSWAYGLFAEIDLERKKNAGFGDDFCPLGLKDGLYKLILQVEEYGEPVTRAETGYVIDKRNGHAALSYRPSEPATFADEPAGWCNGGFNVVKLDEEGTLTLTGWAIIDEVDAYDTDIYIGVSCGGEEMRVYSTIKENITYIADYFENPLYYGAGFKAKLPDVTPKDLKLYIFTIYKGVLHRCSYHFEPEWSLDNMVAVYDLP